MPTQTNTNGPIFHQPDSLWFEPKEPKEGEEVSANCGKLFNSSFTQKLCQPEIKFSILISLCQNQLQQQQRRNIGIDDDDDGDREWMNGIHWLVDLVYLCMCVSFM